MSIVQYTPDNLKIWFGTTQFKCVPLVTFNPIQIVGMAPCKMENTSCSADACLNLEVFDGDYSNFLFQFATDLLPVDVYKLDEWNGNSWVELVTLEDGTHGKKFDLGFVAKNPLYGGYSLDWEKVINIFGSGVYRFRLENVINSGLDLSSLAYNLQPFSCDAANNTVVLKTQQNGIYYNWEYKTTSDTLQSFNILNVLWDDEFRYSGMIDPTQMETEEVFVKYGNFENRLHITNDYQKFLLRIFKSTYEVNQRLFLYALRGQHITVTDYNIDSVYNFVDFDVISGETAPSFERFVNNKVLINTEIELQGAFDDGLRKC